MGDVSLRCEVRRRGSHDERETEIRDAEIHARPGEELDGVYHALRSVFEESPGGAEVVCNGFRGDVSLSVADNRTRAYAMARQIVRPDRDWAHQRRVNIWAGVATGLTFSVGDDPQYRTFAVTAGARGPVYSFPRGSVFEDGALTLGVRVIVGQNQMLAGDQVGSLDRLAEQYPASEYALGLNPNGMMGQVSFELGVQSMRLGPVNFAAYALASVGYQDGPATFVYPYTHVSPGRVSTGAAQDVFNPRLTYGALVMASFCSPPNSRVSACLEAGGGMANVGPQMLAGLNLKLNLE